MVEESSTPRSMPLPQRQLPYDEMRPPVEDSSATNHEANLNDDSMILFTFQILRCHVQVVEDLEGEIGSRLFSALQHFSQSAKT
jgi:hypothetical protein